MTKSHGIIFYLFSMFLFLGLYMSMLQRIIGEIANQYMLSITAMGTIIIMTFVGFAVSSILTGELTDRFGRRIVLLCAFITMLLGFTLTIAIRSPFGASAGFFVCGMAFGVFEMSMSSLLTDIRPESANRVMNNSRIFYALGTIAGPFLAMELLYLVNDWQIVMVFDLALLIVLFVIFLLISYPSPKYPNFIAGKTSKSSITVDLIKNKIVMVFCLSSMMYIAAESGLTFYAAKYVEQLNYGGIFATMALSVFWIFAALGRIISGRIKRNLNLYIGALSLVACAGLVICILTDDLTLSITAFGIMGLGCSGMYPTLLASAKNRFPKYTASLFGIMLSVGALGGIALPYLMGVVADASGLKSALAVCLLPLVVMGAAQIALKATERRREPSEENSRPAAM